MILWTTSFGTILKFILVAYGHVKDRKTPVSLPLALQDMQYVVCVPGWYTLQKLKKSFHSMTLPAILPKDMLVCWQGSISANWDIGGVCKVFACGLGS